ncbi:RNA polymerase sigma factor [Maribacter sp. CXY002]|uniref:RNA polymerase sigma factor n=1 Tax=Maribacter luteocoastalis TaxID=3407671 RepID=UPI003B67A0BE
MKKNDIISNLFRSEFSKIVAVLSNLFGIKHIEIAEDIASETFLTAMETWPYKGIPKNPSAWLFAVAKNKAKNHFIRDGIFRDKIAKQMQENRIEEFDFDLSDKNIADSQLQMLFAVCHPTISEKSQISLALRILCGFGIDEIADAFLTNKETINKRLHRAKEKLRSENIQMEIPPNDQLLPRLDSVLRIIYLVFNEGYYSERNSSLIRQELCLEAMNLNYLLLQNDLTSTHFSNSLMSLMCFHSSRLEARLTDKGEIILYKDQDENLWDTELIEKGFHYLQQASKWEIASKYYLEASIAYWHTIKKDTEEKWESIFKLYDILLKIEYTPIADLNRIFALSKIKGNKRALAEAEKLNLKDNHFYHLLLSALYKGSDENKEKRALKNSLKLCKTETERKFIRKKIENFQKSEESRPHSKVYKK